MAKLTDKFDKLNIGMPGKSEGKKPSNKKGTAAPKKAKGETVPKSEKTEATVSAPVKKSASKPQAKKSGAPRTPMSEKAKKNMVIKFIFGLVVLIVFLIFAYISISVAPHSSDIPDDYIPAFNYHRGVEREKTTTATTTAASYDTPSQEAVPVESDNTAVETSPEETDAPAPEEVQRPEVVKAAALGLPAPPEIDINSWEYILVNQDSMIGSDFRPETFGALNLTLSETDVQYTSDDYSATRCLVDSRIAESLRDFALACKQAGKQVYLSSGYRRYSEQQTLYNNKIGQYSADVARYIVAEPGTSEHQTGLCCDITDVYRQSKDANLENTETFQWLNQHCAEYGFILRYPKDKSGSSSDLYKVGDSITKVIYEPWHFRYVGPEVAKYIMDNNLCLEEFVALYE